MKRQFLSFTLLLALSTWIAQAATVRGTVSDTAGKPLQGVVVTDGYNFTQTNERGEYSLDSNLDKAALSTSPYRVTMRSSKQKVYRIFSISNLIKVRRSMNMILRSPLGNSQSTGLSTWQSPILRPSTNGR